MIDPQTEIKRYPFPSVEIHQTDGSGKPIAGMIDRIALLRQAPRRQLGPMFYSKAHGIREGQHKTAPIYADPQLKRPLAAAERGSVLFYAMESPMPLDDPTSPASANEPGLGDFEKFCEQLKAKYPKLAPLMMEEPPAPLDAPGGQPPLPGTDLDAPGGAPPLPPETPEMYSKMDQRTLANRLFNQSKAVRELQAKLEAREKADAEKELHFSKADAERICDDLEANWGVDMDRAEEVLHFSKLPMGEARVKRADYIKDKYKTVNQTRRAPTQAGFFPTAPNPAGPAPLQYSRAACEAAVAECNAPGATITYEAALEKHKDKR